jgi:hypothetical protein
MRHAQDLILAGRDEARDPATKLFLEQHLRECAECREIRRKVEHAEGLIAAPEGSVPVPPWSTVDRRRVPRPLALAPIAVVLVAVGIVAGAALREWRSANDAASTGQAATQVRPSPTLPAGYQVLTEHDLTIPLPQGWTKTLDAPANSDRPDPTNPRILYFAGTANDPAAARLVAIWIWPSRSLDQLVRERYVQGNLSLISEGTAPSWRAMREVIGVASWSEGSAGGRYRARHLFVQVDPERVVDVVVFGPRIASTETEPTTEMRAIQEIIAGRIVAPSQQAGCPRTQSTDAAGVTTSNGVIGIVGDTYASSAADESRLLVRRGAALGHRVSLEFRQLGASAPASFVTYGVPATLRQTPWGEVAFPFGAKPIGFPNSCWRLWVDGADSGIVLFVGP